MKAIFRSTLVGLLLLGLSCPAVAKQRILVEGTGDSLKLLNVLARDFERGHPDTEVAVPASVGSTGGLKRLLEDDCDLARIARPLRDEERRLGVRYRLFAHSPVVFVAHLETPCLNSLTPQQIVDVYSGRVTSWSQLSPGCQNHKIYVANREDGDSSRTVIERHIPGFNRISTFAGEVIYSTQENQQILERHPFTIGYLPLACVRHSSLVTLSLDGVDPDLAYARNGRYPLAVPLGIAWRGELEGLARAFVDYLSSPEARALIRETGAVPVAADDLR